MSPPLVVAFALAGNVEIDMTKDSLGKSKDGKDVYLKDLWPTSDEINKLMPGAFDSQMYSSLYKSFVKGSDLWEKITASKGSVYEWDNSSTYIQHPPYFENFSLTPTKPTPVKDAAALAIFGDSVTTDHISPAGAIKSTSPAGKWLQEHGVTVIDFNSYGARRGSHDVMIRGTFANVRIKNLMLVDETGKGIEGGFTKYKNEVVDIFTASEKYRADGVPLIVFGGHEYGTGSSRDWAAKGTALLGVRAVVAQSYERIHRSNLVGMGVLPLQFEEGANAVSLGIKGDERFSILGLENGIKPGLILKLQVTKPSGEVGEIPVKLRIDTAIEVQYYENGGILPYVLRQLVA